MEREEETEVGLLRIGKEFTLMTSACTKKVQAASRHAASA